MRFLHLVRKIHRFTAADADLTVFAALNAARVLDVLSSTPARPDSRSPCENSHLRALASRIGEFFALTTVLVLGAGVLPVHAAGDVPAALAARLQMLAPNMEPDYIAEAPLAGMYEVRFGSIIVYLSDDARFMLRGSLIDLDAGRNLTETARQAVRAETVGRLGEANMIVFAPDAPKHTITVFTDVDCGYCARDASADGRLQPSRDRNSGTPRFRGPESGRRPGRRWCRCGVRRISTPR